MFASNNKVSIRQVYRLFVFDLIGMSTLVLPARLAFFSASDGLWAIFFGGLIASFYLWYLGRVVLGMETDFASYMRQRLPVWLEKAVLLFLALFAVWVSGFGAYVFSDVMKRGLIPEESYSLILLLILAAAAYAVHGGIESRARIYEVLFWILAAGLLVMFVIAAFDIQWEYIGPFFESAPSDVTKGGILVFFCCMPLFAVVFFPAYVQRGKEKKMIHAVFAALWCALIVLAVLYFILLGSFGSGALQTMRYPAVTLMSNIHLRSSFLKRFDAFMLGIWFFTLFALINLFLFYGTELLMQVFSKKKSGQHSGADGAGAGEHSAMEEASSKKGKVWWLIGVTAAVFAAAEMFYYGDWTGVFFDFICYVGMPLLVLLPGVVLVIGKSKKRANRMRQLAAIVIVVSLQLAGCSATELENRCFPMMAAVDYRDGAVVFAYGFPELSQKDNTDVEESKVEAKAAQGESFREAHENYARELDKKEDCNHLKVLVLSEAFLRQKDAAKQTIDYLRQSELFPRNTYVCVTDDIGALLESEKSLPTDVGSYLETYLNNHEPEKDAELVNLGTVLDESQNHKKTLQLPYLTVDEDTVLWDGYYVL